MATELENVMLRELVAGREPVHALAKEASRMNGLSRAITWRVGPIAAMRGGLHPV